MSCIDKVYEYTPNVIEPSFGIGRILYALIEHVYWPRPEDKQRGVTSLKYNWSKVLGPLVFCSHRTYEMSPCPPLKSHLLLSHHPRTLYYLTRSLMHVSDSQHTNFERMESQTK